MIAVAVDISGITILPIYFCPIRKKEMNQLVKIDFSNQ
jgi:hypothetical protein